MRSLRRLPAHLCLLLTLGFADPGIAGPQTNAATASAPQTPAEMTARDETLENRLGPGLAVRTSFDVKPGSYMIRLVLRDHEGQLMAAENGAVEIP
jgi:hypothetical protein